MSEVKGKPITKEMWKAVEEELSHSWVSVRFAYMGYELSIARVRVNESKTCLQVYIDDLVDGSWIKFCEGGVEFSDNAPDCIKDVWCASYKSIYPPKRRKELEKLWGKREFKKRYPDADKKWTYYLPSFSKASVLCRQYKKLKGITLLKADCLEDAE